MADQFPNILLLAVIIMLSMKATWIGRAAPAELRAVLRRAGVGFTSDQDEAVVVLRFSRRPSPLPSPPRTRLPWVWLCEQSLTLPQAREAVLAGAHDALSTADANWARRLANRVMELAVDDPPPPAAPAFVAASAAAQGALRELWGAARTSMPLLLLGETGTGKDLFAQLVHDWSARRRARFVPINCAAVPDHLIEGELFGYVRGAFSGAIRDYDGQLLAAAGGTVFLDEIHDTPPTVQTKLLRVLEDRVVSRLGENLWRQVDFRIVAASNKNLQRLIEDKQFGPDLYERLAIVSITLPPLRERLEDLPGLVDHLIGRFHQEEKARAAVRSGSPRVLEALAAYPWPGNVRELRNVIFSALVHKRAGDELLLSDLPRRILRREAGREDDRLFDRVLLERRIAAGTMNLRTEIERLERDSLEVALRRGDGNASRAARLLGEVGRGAASDPGGTVRAMMRRLGMRPQR